MCENTGSFKGLIMPVHRDVCPTCEALGVWVYFIKYLNLMKYTQGVTNISCGKCHKFMSEVVILSTVYGIGRSNACMQRLVAIILKAKN